MDFSSLIESGLSLSGASGILRAPFSGIGPLVAGVEVSVLTGEQHEYSAVLARQALENGAQISDHVIINPERVTVSVGVANAAGGAHAARGALEAFKLLLERAEPLQLATEHHFYDNMLLTAVRPEHRAPFRGALSISLTLERAEFAQISLSGRSPENLPADAAGKSAAAPVNGGEAEAESISAAELARLA